MKRLLLSFILVSFLSLSSFAQKIAPQYIQDIEKPSLLIFTADWCQPCNYMKQNVFTQKPIAELMSQFNVLMIDVSTGVGAIYQGAFCKNGLLVPYFIILNTEGDAVNEKIGAMEEADFSAFLNKAGVLNEGGQGNGNIVYTDVPAKDGFVKGWDLEAGLGLGLGSCSNIESSRLGITVLAEARYRSRRQLGFRTGLELSILPAAVDMTPSISLLLPINLDLFFGQSLYGTFGAYAGLHSVASLGARGDVGARFGAGYLLESFDLRCTYNLGALNINKGDIMNPIGARYLNVSLGYRF